MEAAPKHSVSVAGIVVDKAGRVLVIRRRDNGHWEPPGGILELDESFEDGVCREVFEETGLHVHVDRLTGVYKNIRIGVVALVFRCTPLSADVQVQSHEADTIQWVNLADIANLMDPAFAIRVTDAFNDYTPTRLHDGIQLISG
jgi:8-oxo-dGTP pyrophosphatase MutT (NUDIX family)